MKPYKVISAGVIVSALSIVAIALVSAQISTDTPYIPPVETGDSQEVSWNYVAGQIDDRLYQDQTTFEIRFRRIDPRDGQVIMDQPATLEQIAYYSITRERNESYEQQRSSKLQLQQPFDVDGRNFPDWLLEQAQIANVERRSEDAILFMGMYHYMMADNPELFITP